MTRSATLVSMVVALSWAGSLGAATPAEPSEVADIKGGQIVWGVKGSFRCYVLHTNGGPPPYPYTGCNVPPAGSITPDAPAAIHNPEATYPRDRIFRVPVEAAGQYNPSAETAKLTSSGRIRFLKPGHIDLTLSNLRIEVDGNEGTLFAHVKKPRNELDAHSPMDGERALGVLVNLEHIKPVTRDGVSTWTGVDVKPVAPQEIFGSAYTELDQVTFSIDTGAPRAISGGHADWGISKTFRNCMAGSPPFPGTASTDGVSNNADGSYRFPAKPAGQFDPASNTASAEFTGRVRFSNLLGKRTDVSLEDPQVLLAGSSSVLKARVIKIAGGSTTPIMDEVRVLARLDLSNVTATTGGGVSSWQDIPAQLDTDAEDVFGDECRAGTQLEPLSVSLSSSNVDPPLSPNPEPYVSPAPPPSPSPAATERGGGPDIASQKEASVLGGYMHWGLKKSFRDYINGPIAHGQMRVSEGAALNPDGTVKFPAAGEGKVGAGARSAASAFSGVMSFTGHDGQLDMKLANPRVEIDGSGGRLLVDVTSKSAATQQDPNPSVKSYPGLAVASLDLSASAPSAQGSTVTWDKIPATLTEQGAQAFSGFYQPGTPLDPVHVVLELAQDVDVAPVAGVAEQLAHLDKARVRPGEKLTVSSPGFQGGEQVEVWVHSTPVFVGAATSDAGGKATYTFSVPVVPPGIHRVEVRAVTSGKSVYSPPFTVLSLAARRGTLPATGIDAEGIFLFALACLAAGALLLWLGTHLRRIGPMIMLAALTIATSTVTANGQEPAPASAAPVATLAPDGLSATDGVRTLIVSKSSGLSEQGEQIRVEGRGYGDPIEYKGIYVAFCVIPPTNQQPTPCLGGADTTGQSGSSHWITSNPPPNSSGLYTFYGPDGSFSVNMLVSPHISPTIDCRRIRCAVVTRNDHTRTSDRSQDLFLPVTFALPPVASPPALKVLQAPPPPDASVNVAEPPPTSEASAKPLVQALPAPAVTLSPDGLSASDSVRTLTVSRARNLDPEKHVVEVKGSGYDPQKRFLLALCVLPGAGKAPGQCFRSGPLKISTAPTPGEVQLAPGGSFSSGLEVGAQIDEATDCREVPCAIVTFNDTDRPVDRSQDIFIPVSFKQPGQPDVPAAAVAGSASTDAGFFPALSFAAGASALLTAGALALFRRRKNRHPW